MKLKHFLHTLLPAILGVTLAAPTASGALGGGLLASLESKALGIIEQRQIGLLCEYCPTASSCQVVTCAAISWKKGAHVAKVISREILDHRQSGLLCEHCTSPESCQVVICASLSESEVQLAKFPPRAVLGNYKTLGAPNGFQQRGVVLSRDVGNDSLNGTCTFCADAFCAPFRCNKNDGHIVTDISQVPTGEMDNAQNVYDLAGAGDQTIRCKWCCAPWHCWRCPGGCEVWPPAPPS